MAKKTKQKFAYGGTAMNIDSPSASLLEHKKISEDARIGSQYDSTVQGLNMLGNTLSSIGMGMIGGGLSKATGDLGGLGDFFKKNFGTISQIVTGVNTVGSTMSTGGTTGNKVEAEGEEVVETPNGQVQELNGPSHENGGIDMLVPPGTDFFSARLIGDDGKTMAERKKNREASESKIQKLIDKEPMNSTLKKTLDKTRKNNKLINQQDLDKMNFVQEFMGSVQKFAAGGTSGDKEIDEINMINPKAIKWKPANMDPIFNTSPTVIPQVTMPGYIPNVAPQTEETFSLKDYALPTAGDALGIIGNLGAGLGMMRNTIKARQAGVPEVNHYQDFGKEALGKIREQIPYINQVRDEQLGDLELSRNASFRRNNNSARGVNTQRAMNLATDAQINAAQDDIYNQFAAQTMGIMGQEANQLNTMDEATSRGEMIRADNEVKNSDNFYSNLARDIASKGAGIAMTGKTLNQMKERESTLAIMKQMYNDFYVDSNNELVAKENATPNHSDRPDLNLRSPYEKLKEEKSKYFNADGKINEAGLKELEKSGKLKNIKGKDGGAITAKEYVERAEAMTNNKYLPNFEDLDTTYKTKTDPSSKRPFSSFEDYTLAQEAGIDLKDWNTFKDKDLSVKEQAEIENALQEYGINVDTSDKKSVEALQKLLGFTKGKGLDGVLGKGTINKLLKRK